MHPMNALYNFYRRRCGYWPLSDPGEWEESCYENFVGHLAKANKLRRRDEIMRKLQQGNNVKVGTHQFYITNR